MFNKTAKHSVLRRLNFFLLIAIFFYGYSFLFLGAYYSHPNAEDLSLSANAKNHGILYSVIQVLVSYDGRYFTNILHAINPLAYGCISCYKFISVFSIVLPILCLSFFLRSISTTIRKLQIALLSSLFVLINCAISPSLVHQIYWMSSSFVYHYSWCFYLLWTGSLIRSLKTENKKLKYSWFLVSTFLLVCSMGINEMFLVINTLSLLAFLIYTWKYAKKDLAFLLPLLVSAGLSVLFFLSNPGIIKRIHSFETQHESIGPVAALLKSSSHFGQELFHYFSYLPFLLPLSILFLLCFFKDLKLNIKFSSYFLLIPFVMLHLALLAFYLPMGFETSIPLRIYTTIYFGFLLYFTIVVPLFFHDRISKILDVKYAQPIILVSLLILGTSFFLLPNNISLLKEDYLSGKMQKLDFLCKTRYALIQESKNKVEPCWKQAVIPALNNAPKSIYHQPDIKPNRTEPYWNAAFERYFLINEVLLEGDTVSLIENLQNQELP